MNLCHPQCFFLKTYTFTNRILANGKPRIPNQFKLCLTKNNIGLKKTLFLNVAYKLFLQKIDVQ